MRVWVYIDGFNLYYRALQNSSYKWLDLLALAHSLLKPTDTVEAVRYFTARVSARAGDPGAPGRQQVYLSALATLPQISVHFGSFLTKTKRRPLVNPVRGLPKFVEVYDTEEKGSDVNLAAHLLNDGWQRRYDAALVMSQDTDLCEAMRMVRDDVKKPVGLVWLDGQQPSTRLKDVSSFVRHVTSSRLAAAQFPDPVIDANGRRIQKPVNW